MIGYTQKFEVINMQVQLPQEQEIALYDYVSNVLNKAVEDVQQKAGFDNPWIKGKKKAAEWLGTSPQTLNKLMQRGMPVHYLDDMDVAFFYKNEITEYLLKQ